MDCFECGCSNASVQHVSKGMICSKCIGKEKFFICPKCGKVYDIEDDPGTGFCKKHSI